MKCNEWLATITNQQQRLLPASARAANEVEVVAGFRKIRKALSDLNALHYLMENG